MRNAITDRFWEFRFISVSKPFSINLASQGIPKSRNKDIFLESECADSPTLDLLRVGQVTVCSLSTLPHGEIWGELIAYGHLLGRATGSGRTTPWLLGPISST